MLIRCKSAIIKFRQINYHVKRNLMSSDSIELELKERDVIRKGLNKLRADGKVPAVIHNHGEKSIHVVGDYIVVSKAYKQAGKHHPLELNISGKKHLVLIKNVDFEPTKHNLRHVVFQAIRQNEKVEAEIPLKLEGEIPAEKAGLMVITNLDTIVVEAFPKDLPDELTVDASKLNEVGDSLTVADIVVPENVTILTEAEHGIAVVEMPKDQIAEANAAAEDLAADKAESESEDGSEQTPSEEGKDEAPTAESNQEEKQS